MLLSGLLTVGLLAVPVAAQATQPEGAVFVSLNGQVLVNDFPNGPVLPLGQHLTVKAPNGANTLVVNLFGPSPCGVPC